jgi:hypothetical protein
VGTAGGAARLSVRIGEVSVSSAERELAESLGFGLDANGPITTLADGLGRMISQNVLMLGLFRQVVGSSDDRIAQRRSTLRAMLDRPCLRRSRFEVKS